MIYIIFYIKIKLYFSITYSELDIMVMFNSGVNDEMQNDINFLREEFIKQQHEVDELMIVYERRIKTMMMLFVLNIVMLALNAICIIM